MENTHRQCTSESQKSRLIMQLGLISDDDSHHEDWFNSQKLGRLMSQQINDEHCHEL